ncbi:MAG: MbcA/ParS/Xre antitoxin family protein [Rhodospirillales bacterium]
MSRKSSVEQALGAAEVAEIVGGSPGGERLEALHCIWDGLLDLYTPQQAAAWLQTAAPGLKNRRPVDIMREPDGLNRVLDLVSRLTWGLPE